MKLNPCIRYILTVLISFSAIGALLQPDLSLADDTEANSTEESQSLYVPNLSTYLTPELLGMIFPEAERFGDIEGTPPSAPVFQGDTLLGYVFETYDLVQGRGFSKRPFHILVGMN